MVELDCIFLPRCSTLLRPSPFLSLKTHHHSANSMTGDEFMSNVKFKTKVIITELIARDLKTAESF